MLSLQPVFLHKYFSYFRSSWRFNQPTKTLFYLSWEDALWDLLNRKNISSKSVILVPDFFCDDVENNMRAHGLTVATYPVASNLQTAESDLIQAIQRHKPAIIVVFHAVGIGNKLFENRAWIDKVSSETILIEDCVHRMIDPSQVTFYKKNHFLITSLRKVVPLQGSVLFGRSEDLPFSEANSISSWWYSMQVHFLWFLMNLTANISHRCYSVPQLAKKLSLLAENLMLLGYDVIGDNRTPAKGWPLFYWLYRHFNFKEIKQAKVKQAVLYEKLFPSVNIIYEQADRKELRGWPLIISLDTATTFIENVRNEGLYLRYELNNSEWSRKQKIVYLPMGPYISTLQQEAVATVVKKYL